VRGFGRWKNVLLCRFQLASSSLHPKPTKKTKFESQRLELDCLLYILHSTAAANPIDPAMEVSASTSIIRVDASTRRMHLAGLLPVTRPAQNAFTPLESRVYYIAGGHLALKHFNERSNDVIPDLSERLQGCDIELTIEYRDTQYSRIVGAGHLSDILQKWPRNTMEDPFPSAIVGAGRSDVSETISTLSGMFQLPVVSPHSSAASLDDKVQYPYFARTTPSNAAGGRAAVDYFHHLQVSHMGLIYVLDTNGIAYQEAIQRVSRERGMTTISIAYEYDAGEYAMQQALKALKATGVRYVFAAIEPQRGNNSLSGSFIPAWSVSFRKN
jgi:hypothetical protein